MAGSSGRGSTLPELPDLAAERRSWRIRRAALLVVLLFVAAGLAGLWGVRTGTVVSVSDGGIRVQVDYPRRARPALAVPFSITISRRGGFDEPIVVATTTRYLQTFDENGTNPQPDAATADGDRTIWTFEPPSGDVLTIWLDTRVEPAVQWRRSGTTTVSSGADEVSVHYTSWIFP